MQKDFSDSYRSTQWQEKKNKILTRDDYTCAICGKHGDEHTLMHVHHLTYKNCKNGKAWDCPDEDLVTLCEDCHKEVHSGKPFHDPAENYFYFSHLQNYIEPLDWVELANKGTIAIIGCRNEWGNLISGCKILFSDSYCENHELMAYTFSGGMLRYDVTWIDKDSYEGFSIPDEFRIIKNSLLSDWLYKLINEVKRNCPEEDTNTYRVIRCLNQQGFDGLTSFDFIVNFYTLFSRMEGFDNLQESFFGDIDVNALMGALFGPDWAVLAHSYGISGDKTIDTNYIFHELIDK